MSSTQNFNQGTFPCSILSEKRKDFSAIQIEVDPLESLHSREELIDLPHLKQGA